jgi:hypothetical protein
MKILASCILSILVALLAFIAQGADSSALALSNDTFPKDSSFGIAFPIDQRICIENKNILSKGGMCNVPLLFPQEHQEHFLSKAQFSKFLDIALKDSNAQACTPNADSRFLFTSDKDLIQKDVNLSRIRGIDLEACNTKNWRVVSVLYRHCREFKNDELNQKCKPEFRLVAQPFTYNEFGWFSHDYAIHLVYKVNDVKSLTKDIASLMSDAGERVETVQSRLNSQRHICGNSLANKIGKLIKAYAKPEYLTDLAWSISSHNNQHWTFGKLSVSQDGKLESINLSNSKKFENLSKPLFIKGECSISEFDSNSDIQMLFGCYRYLHNQDASEPLQVIHRLTDLKNNPDNNGSCIACHLSRQLEYFHRTHEMFDENGILKMSKEGLLVGNMRQFGYNYKGELSISPRTAKLLQGNILALSSQLGIVEERFFSSLHPAQANKSMKRTDERS